MLNSGNWQGQPFLLASKDPFTIFRMNTPQVNKSKIVIMDMLALSFQQQSNYKISCSTTQPVVEEGFPEKEKGRDD